jgi:hypothetical protein
MREKPYAGIVRERVKVFEEKRENKYKSSLLVNKDLSETGILDRFGGACVCVVVLRFTVKFSTAF